MPTVETLKMVPPWFFQGVAFLFGAIVGSFLNVCIHRMPRGHSIVAPRSKCYSCEHPVRWIDNIPLVSFILLGGKCRDCGAKFSIRYWIVELLTALVFLGIWIHFSFPQNLVYAVFLAGLIVATFVDFEHLIIPDEITWGGVFVGIILSGIFPVIQDETRHFMGAVWSLAGGALGFFSLWAVVEGGKKIFGVKKLVLPKEEEVVLSPDGIKIGTEELEKWEEFFFRESDVLAFEASEIQKGEKSWKDVQVQVSHETIQIGTESFQLNTIETLRAKARTFYIPREAMGFGDVKFLAAIGAFLGPKAILFVILISSLLGSVIGIGTMVFGKREWGLKIPYGPYLALGAVAWILWGRLCLDFYFRISE